ncbi:hypothetical protein DR864_08030 [Runella rosea]|uniref:DUF2892 domain-containing protein n=1 Tax=Runella rosea TaxID=2259595 RepID=A0A344TGB7_9BACT|nr:hypothetical protein [Runella rosea]AXE17688.1 hypothetical protein DR864_08030 [Runella rosea]
MTAVLKNWDFMRILRMGMSLWLIYSAFVDHQPLLGLLGGLFALQAVMNVGCCGSGGCAAPNTRQSAPKTIEETQYEEVK